MSDMRGGFIRGNRATITIDDQVTTDHDPNSPGSASVTVNLGPNTVSRASASTTGTNGYSSASVTITGAVTTNTGTLSAGSMMRALINGLRWAMRNAFAVFNNELYNFELACASRSSSSSVCSERGKDFIAANSVSGGEGHEYVSR